MDYTLRVKVNLGTQPVAVDHKGKKRANNPLRQARQLGGENLPLDTAQAGRARLRSVKRKRPQTLPSQKRPLRTPKSTQARVVAASFAGRSQRQIERETGIARTTISRILSQEEVKTLIASYRDEYRDLVPGAIALLAHEMSLKPKGKRHATSDQIKAAIEITKGAQVAVPLSKGALEVRTDQFAAMTDQELDEYIADANKRMAAAKATQKPGNA